MSKVVIEGTLNYEEDSSSESGEDTPQRPLSPPMVYSEAADADDEEIEYFGEQPVRPQKAALPAPSPVHTGTSTTGTESKLASILQGSVQAFEMGSPLPAPPAPTISAAPPKPPTSTEDEFGIAYHSTRRNHEPANTVPVVNALDDFSADIEERLLRTAAPTIENDDDEFELDDPVQAPESVEAIRRAIEKAATVTTEETTPAPSQTNEANVLAADIIHKAPTAEDDSVTVQSILAGARKAFAEVSEVYASGLGDQEVLIGSVSGDDKDVKAAQPIAALKGINVIEEGDEDAAEEEEALEEARAEEVRLATETAKTELESQWEGLENAPSAAGNSVESGAGTAQNASEAVPMVTWTFTKAVRYFQNLDFSAHRPHIVVREEVKGGWFSSAPKPIAYKNSDADLELPFLIAQVDYDPCCTEHFHMLCTLYAYFVEGQNRGGKGASKTAAVRNWEKLGFQGNDPRTDLNRSMKMLSVLQMMSFIDQDARLARRMFELSQSAQDVTAGSLSVAERNARAKGDTSWPFLCVAIMFTREALQALRRGVLNDKCTKRGTVLGVLNEFHRACFAEFECLLKEQPAVHHAVHLATLRKSCESNPLKLMKKYKAAYTAAKEAAGGSNSSAGGQKGGASEDSDFRFDNLESVPAGGGEESAHQGGGSSAAWTSIFGGERRASKFAVS